MLGWRASGAPRADTSADPAGLVILPDAVVLRGQGSRQQLLIERAPTARFVGTAPGRDLLVVQPDVATVDESGVVTAVGDGRAIVTARTAEGSVQR